MCLCVDDMHGMNIFSDNYSRNSNSQNSGTEPCYFNSSIYYGGQQVYSPNNPAADSLPIVSLALIH